MSNQLIRPLSECCKAEIMPATETFGSDKCSVCQRIISYALMDMEWAAIEPCGVFENFAGDKFFFWQQMSRWAYVEKVGGSPIYLGQIKRLIDSPAARYNEDLDMIPTGVCVSYMRKYKPQVKNPNICDHYCHSAGFR